MDNLAQSNGGYVLFIGDRYRMDGLETIKAVNFESYALKVPIPKWPIAAAYCAFRCVESPIGPLVVGKQIMLPHSRRLSNMLGMSH